MTRSLVFIPVSFIVFLLLQVMLLQRIVLFDTAFCLAYAGFILFAPMEISTVVLMLMGFGFGLSLDLFQNSAGVHASATVLLAFVRNYWLEFISPLGGYDAAGADSYDAHGLVWLLTYVAPLLLIHHFILFYVEAGGFHMFWTTFGKVFFSFLFTLTVLLLYRLFTGSRR
ncbi:MAG: Rod shape-determining protein MreD [Bacteroidetes bacterium]|nr:Rod shape-determining protein MreD [Bacteroidota bacterium]